MDHMIWSISFTNIKPRHFDPMILFGRFSLNYSFKRCSNRLFLTSVTGELAMQYHLSRLGHTGTVFSGTSCTVHPQYVLLTLIEYQLAYWVFEFLCFRWASTSMFTAMVLSFQFHYVYLSEFPNQVYCDQNHLLFDRTFSVLIITWTKYGISGAVGLERRQYRIRTYPSFNINQPHFLILFPQL